MTYIQALKKLIAHLEERVNRNVVDIQLAADKPIDGRWKFFVSYDDEYEDNMDVIYIKDVA